MMRKFKRAVLVGTLVGIGLSGQAQAAKKPVETSQKKVVVKKAGAPVAVAERKSLRRVALSEAEAGRLALYSASALVLDQATGLPIVEKNPGSVTPIASISKLMTAMVVLDAGLDMQEVIAIGDEDVDSLKGTRSRLPVGTTMTRETAMLLALMSSENRAAHALGR
ncbi:MAG: peptidase, partial [Betaproteobacteria bacterium]|nr:peptidase [Betaproteobacteria bacterium]